MPSDHRVELAAIKRFDQLVRYLRDPMGWPIEGDDFEEVTFDYTPEELGIEAKSAAKIQEIKRLRPLSPNQPWGIFFVKFEPKNLPVVALRRILSSVALKKRASANAAERAAWAADDLLFISNYGHGEERQISFAHFSRAEDGRDLPTLKVLGWDNLDTALHLDAVAKELTQHLAWPKDDSDPDAWRTNWRTAFNLRHREVVTTSKELSIRLAELARSICDRIKTAVAIETENGPLTKLMKAFQQALVHDLDADGFADMYAQTIAYGLLSARIADPTKKTADDFAAHMRTSPFLRELMEHFLHVGGRRGKAGGPGIDFDELGVSEVIDLLDAANMEAVVRDFGDKNRQDDPVIHFYELFLHAYNKQLRIQRGVFYTPQPVVSYIVRSVHEMLQTEFGLVDGLADTATWGEILERHSGLQLPLLTDLKDEQRTISPDEPFVQILDPATGTATFLVEVIDVIHHTLTEKWKQQRLTGEQRRAAWNDYVPRHLLPRLHAYELMMAPYAIAHMKIGLKLAETGYQFEVEERARIYLTNALEPWLKQLPLIGLDALAHEAAAVNEIKRHKRFTVVVGNPPYSNFGQLNRGPFVLDLLDDYKRGLNEKKLNLDDDFIKFVRIGQHLICQSGAGVLGYITNNVYADGVTHRRMRQSLMESFRTIRLLDLHGSSKRREQAPDGSKDENVFDITIGVCVGIFARNLSSESQSKVYYGELWGDRTAKYVALANLHAGITPWAQLPAAPPHFFFVPKDFDRIAEYQRGMPVQQVFPLFSSGIQTKRDNVAIAESKENLLVTLKRFSRLPASELRSLYGLPDDGRDWRIEWASAHAKEILRSPETIAPILYRPFDKRWTVLDNRSKGFVAYPRYDVMSQMVHQNLGLIVTRQLSLPTFQHVFATRQLIDGNTISLQTREYNYLFPLYLHGEQAGQRSLSFSHGRINLGVPFLKALAQRLKLSTEGNGLPIGVTPEDIFYYAYAILHSPGYRNLYSEFLKIDFPRLPLTGNLRLFRTLCELGGELVALHILESPKLDQAITEFVGSGDPEVEKITWARNAVWIDRAQTIGFRGVSQSVWDFRIGGYQVCEKWLKDRRGSTLSKNEVVHYQKIVVALSETARLMEEIDEAIEQYGGWPGAFASDDEVGTHEVSGGVVSVSAPGAYQAAPSDRLKAAEPEAPPYKTAFEATRLNPDDLDREELICRIRHLFGDGQGRERDAAIDALARELGYQRTGARVYDELDNAMRAAARRGITTSERGVIRLFARAIEDYDRDFLKEQFLASLQGRQWAVREEAIRSFARWMGFRRTGPAIEDAARSLINGLLREGRLESGGSEIRRSD
ncbi:hypothetical protein OZ411_22390 [Bradyrhizobium sp. Arg237L]|uniref:type ISP restriction/modification enzyme n=1 Tax=Bradyrhizobium sp. Arg237L TaxID=3003352 RepID=UPI00249EEC6B|nr:type ISP restriction/modification enzyme [Bradyrhizobium sp. Arg237L]MDI4235560.1 hypothetical protein [Bradyrhizobium sp. Arg237L]